MASISNAALSQFATEWLTKLDDKHDKILLRRAFIDLCDGDHAMALLFAQLLYFYLPDKNGGGTKLRVRKEGFFWLAKQHDAWWDECRIRSARHKIDGLRQRGLIRTENFRFNGIKTQHLRIDFDGLEARVNALDQRPLNKPVKSETSNRAKANRSDNPGTTGLPSKDKPLTDTTAETPTEIKTPLPSADAEGVSSDSSLPGKSINPVKGIQIPHTRDPAFPRTNGRPDWCEAVRIFDLPAATAMIEMMGDPNTPLISQNVARKWVKRRYGALAGQAPYILARYYLRGRWEGTERPACHGIKRFEPFLNDKVITVALQGCYPVMQEELAELAGAEAEAKMGDFVNQEMRRADLELTSPDLLEDWVRCSHLACAALVVGHRRGWDTTRIKEEFEDWIWEELLQSQAWIIVATPVDFEPVFGFSLESVEAEHEKINAVWKAARQEVLALRDGPPN